MPLKDLAEFLKEIPRLQAEHAFYESRVHAVGTGSMSREDSREVLNEWRKDALDGLPVQPAKRQTSAKDAMEFAKSIGRVKVEVSSGNRAK